MPADHLSESQLRVLEALALYRYLTAQQVVDLGIYKNLTGVRDQLLKPMARRFRPLVAFRDFGSELPGKGGRIPFVYCLTKRGVDWLADLHRIPAELIVYPKHGIQFSRDVFHRIATVDCHIRIRQWAAKIGAEVVKVEMYFDPVGTPSTGGQKKATRIDLDDSGRNWIEADGIFFVRFGEATIVYVLEVHRFTDAGRVAQQLARHSQVLEKQALQQKYQVSNIPYILSVYDRYATVSRRADQMQVHNRLVLETVRSRVQTFPEMYRSRFLFCSLAQLKTNISHGWVLADGRPQEPFPVPETAFPPKGNYQ